MSLSRGSYLFRQFRSAACKNNVLKQQVRNSSDGWVYRTSGHEHNKNWLPLAEGSMAIAWWWWLWHVYHEYDWVTGEFYWPDPRYFTDEELGIPQD